MMRSYRRLYRRGGAVLELILCLPVLIIALFAIAEFGVLMANQQQLEYASRIGALVASETNPLPSDDPSFAADGIAMAVKRHLQQSGIDISDANLRITLEHNVGGGPHLRRGTWFAPLHSFRRRPHPRNMSASPSASMW